jgi:hypothetical protein
MQNYLQWEIKGKSIFIVYTVIKGLAYFDLLYCILFILLTLLFT